MSSTLFARGTMTQVGLRQRAEGVNRNIAEIRAMVDSVQDLPREFRVMRSRVDTVETHAASITGVNKLLAEMTDKMSRQQNTITILENKFAQLDSVLERLVKLEALNEEFKSMEEEFDTVNTRVKTCETLTEGQNVKVTKINSRVNALEKASADAAAAAATASASN